MSASTPIPAFESVAALQRAAQRQADGFSRPATPWAPPRTALHPRLRRGAIIVLLVGAGSALVLGLNRHRAAPTLVAAPLPAPLPAIALRDLPAPAPAPAAAQSPLASGGISADRDRIRIDISAMPLAAAAAQLAAATHTALDGSDALRDATARVTLKWQGRSVGAAWRQLLAAEASYAAVCGDRGCSVRVLGPLASQRAESPTTAAAATAIAPQPDPPGLFPSDG